MPGTGATNWLDKRTVVVRTGWMNDLELPTVPQEQPRASFGRALACCGQDPVEAEEALHFEDETTWRTQ